MTRVQSLLSYPPSHVSTSSSSSPTRIENSDSKTSTSHPIESTPSSVSRYSSIILFVVVPPKLTTYEDYNGERTIFLCSGSWPLCKPKPCTYISPICLCHIRTFSGVLTLYHAGFLHKRRCCFGYRALGVSRQVTDLICRSRS